ncbi:hypothetical protein D6C90_06972 [Aureobasidium pullulans]|nr:hypothetical protein D6C90_06972 [Aureobasidium pullulans]CAC9893175.1 unnamed protein product [Aureobasidium pullulans]
MAPTDGKLAMSASPTLPTSDNFETRDIRGMVVPAHDCDQAIPNYSTSTAVPSAPLRIGAGHCGSVWTVADASWVIKRADGSKHRSLWKEYYLQNRILSHLDKSTAITTNIQIPASFWYTSTNGCNIMCSERIPPLSSTFRNLLVDSFCPEEARQCVKDRDTVCIGRIYLGRRRFGRPSKFFSLNNYALLVDSMEQLGLPIHEYAGYIAEALAILHWDAEVDANDVEFVLGSRRQLPTQTCTPLSSSYIAKLPYNSDTRSLTEPEPTTKLQPQIQDLQVWVLDFDCCDSISMDIEGVEKAAVSAQRNDPYSPKPCASGTKDYELWKRFRDRYLAVGTEIVQRRQLEETLPRLFIERLVVLQGETPSEHQHFPRGPYCARHNDEEA